MYVPVELVEELTGEALRHHLREQRFWPVIRDCERLDAAFAELEQAGILARQNAECCGTCALHEVWQEVEGRIAEGRPVRGFTYFHEQGTSKAISGAGLVLYFRGIKETPESTISIGQEVVATLHRHGFRLSWDGTAERCILVEITWNRRGPTKTEG